MISQLQSLNEFISHHQFLGIPLDIPAHLIIGGLMLIPLLKITKNRKIILLMILSIALLKEAYDQEIMTNTIQENIKDTLVTMLIPSILLFFQTIPFGRQAR